MFTAAENEAMIRDTGGVQVAHGSITTWGHSEKRTELVDDGQGAPFRVVRSVIKVATGVLADLAVDDEISVAGVLRRVADHYPDEQDDGLLVIEMGG